MDHIMRAENLTKRYGDRIVVDGVDIEVNGGEIFGLFGPNGSGKSTILRMLTGITQPSRGTVQIGIQGKPVNVSSDPLLVREHASILTETPALYENMELYQYLKFYGRLSRISEDDLSQRVLEAVTIVGMEDHLYRPLRQMSMGERQRVEIARVLIKNSPIMFLDEPFNGIDITTRREIRDYLKNVWLNETRCVFFTSHNLLESEHFVDRFSFIYQGKIIASGDEDELKARFSATKYAIHCTDEHPGRKAVPPLAERVPPGVHPDTSSDIILDEDLPVMSGPQRGLAILVSQGLIEEGEVTGNRLIVTLSAKSELDSVIQALVTNGISFQEVHPVGTIEDIFITMLDEKKKEEERPIRDSYDDYDDDPESDPYNGLENGPANGPEYGLGNRQDNEPTNGPENEPANGQDNGPGNNGGNGSNYDQDVGPAHDFHSGHDHRTEPESQRDPEGNGTESDPPTNTSGDEAQETEPGTGSVVEGRLGVDSTIRRKPELEKTNDTEQRSEVDQ